MAFFLFCSSFLSFPFSSFLSFFLFLHFPFPFVFFFNLFFQIFISFPAWFVVWKAILSKIPLIRELAGLDGKKKDPTQTTGTVKDRTSQGTRQSKSRQTDKDK